MSRATSQSLAGLVIAIGVFIALWLVYPHEFEASDPWAYSSRAFGIADQHHFGPNDVFSHRVGVTIPTAFFYTLFGVNEVSTNLWPLCASLLIIVVVCLALPDTRSRAIGVALCVTSVALLRASTSLMPDIVGGAFMAASSMLLFRRRHLIAGGAWWPAPLAVALVFIAFVAKESAYWILPLWLVALVLDWRHTEWRELWRRFYIPAVVSGVVIGVAYLAFCAVQWGHPLTRFAAIQALTGQHLWEWSKASTWEFAKRLTVAPAMLLTSQYGLPVLALAAIGFVVAPLELVPWGWYTVACLFFYWFGSTSFTRYEPMPLAERMTLPALPGLYILAAYAASRVAVLASPRTWYTRWLPAALIASLVAAPFAEELLSWRKRDRPEAAAMAIVRDAVVGDPTHRYLLLSSDPRSPESLAFFFGYQYPPNLSVESVDTFLQSAAPADVTRAFVFVHHDRSLFLTDAWKSKTYDTEIASIDIKPAYEVDGVSLRVTDDVSGLMERLQSVATTER